MSILNAFKLHFTFDKDILRVLDSFTLAGRILRELMKVPQCDSTFLFL